MPKPTSQMTLPKPTLTIVDAIALIVGTVIGAGIFETPALVAANASSQNIVLLAWVLGGILSLVGALCYAELTAAYPHPGGVYYYLQRTFGKPLAFLFAWARMTVIQTGSITLLAFVFGDYASQLLKLGDNSASVYAVLAIALLTGLNILGVQQGKGTQNWLTAAKVLGLLLVVIMGLLLTPAVNAESLTQPGNSANWGLMMIFVLLSYGGWNEAAYISAELQGGKRNMVKALLWSIGIITGIYALINLAYIHGLGLTGMAGSEAVAADLLRRAIGEPGAGFISVLIAISTLGAINATIFTGARTNYALGQDFSRLSFLGRWHHRGNTPIQAFMVQGGIALALVILGTLTRKGFKTMVDYTAPAFWFFFLLTGVALLILRIREPQILRPFRVPLYPLTPILFCATCGYLLYSSLVYTGIGALVGVAATILGIPVLLWSQRSP
jgi:amino acid transporter